MFEVGSIPDKCKVGIIIPLHKPGKSRDSPDSDRPITLLSAIYKLFERVFLKRLQHWTLLEGKHFPNPQQNAYQKHFGALTAIVKEYASPWRFLFNPDKCHLIVFSPSRPPTNLSVEFSHSNITQKESITHVAIELHQSLKSSLAIDARIKKGKASLFSLLAIDRETGFVSPSILASLVEKICFPIVLYGAKLWHNMSSADIYKLEKFIRLAAKSIQRFPSRTGTVRHSECLVGCQ